MAEEWNQSQDSLYNNLIGIVLPGIKEPTPEKIAALENMCREIADSKNTNRAHALKTVITSSLSKDLFEAWAEWQFSHARKSTDGAVEDIGGDEQATGSLYGRKLKKAYFFKNRRNPELPLLQMGGTLYYLFKSSLEGFGTPAENKLLSAREKKKRQLADVLQDPKASLESLIESDEESRGIVSDMLEIAKDKLVDFAAALGLLRKISPELGKMRDPTRNLVHLQRGRSILSWYDAEQESDSLPEYVRQAYYRLEDSLLDASPLDTFIFVNYAAKKRYVNRHSVLNGIDDDLLLMAKPQSQKSVLKSFGISWTAPVVQRLVAKYGKADLSGVKHLLDQDNITEFDGARLLMLKPNVYDFRVEANSGIDSSYAHNLGSIFDKVVPIFMKDRFVLCDEFQRKEGYKKFRTHLYATVLNKDDYIVLRDLVWKLSASEGDIAQNMLEQYSVPEFAKQRDALEVLAARIELAEKLAAKQGINAADLYSIPEAELKKISEAANLKGAPRDKNRKPKYFPAARFESHPDNRSGRPLDEVIDTFDTAGHKARQNSGVRRMVDTHMRRIRMLADVEIFHADDMKRLNDWYGVAKAHTERVDDLELKGLGCLLSKAVGDWRVRLAEGVMALKGIMSKERIRDARQAAKEYDEFTGTFSSEQEKKEYDENLSFLQGIVDKAVIYSGRTARPAFSDKDRLEIKAVKLNDDWQKAAFWRELENNPWSGVLHVYAPDKVKAKVGEVRDDHATLAELYGQDADFRKRLEAVVASGRSGLMSKFHFAESGFMDLQAIVGAENPENVYLSNELVMAMHDVCNRMETPHKANDAYKVDLSVLDATANIWYEKTAGDQNIRYDVLIPGGRRGAKDDTYPHQQFLKRRLRMLWNRRSYGYELRGITEEQLGEVTSLLAARNREYNSTLLVKLTK